MDRDKMSILYRGPSIDASYQDSVHLAEGFQRRRLKCEKLTDDRRRTPSDGKSSLCLWQGELKTTKYQFFCNWSIGALRNFLCVLAIILKIATIMAAHSSGQKSSKYQSSLKL
jgi:hypothetical protein